MAAICNDVAMLPDGGFVGLYLLALGYRGAYVPID